jgi:glycosyltransferase involved in cell wall biosynthesis
MHCLPVISTFPEKPSRYITEQNTHLVPPQSPRELAAAVLRLCTDAPARERMIENARHTCRQFSWTLLIERIEQEFRAQIGRPV